MSITHSLTINCDGCGETLTTRYRTGHGARGRAERAGWRVPYLAGGEHPTKRSNDVDAPDLCPACRPDKPRPDVGLFAKGGQA